MHTVTIKVRRACLHQVRLTLFDIMMVSRDLLWELKATLRVVA